jgi:hypothetical protein
MLRWLLFTLFCLLNILSSKAQADSTVLKAPYSDGVFLTYIDFRHNLKITKEEITSALDKRQLDFFTKALAEKELHFSHFGEVSVVECKNVWGYFQNNTLYLNYRGDFYRVPVFGAFSYLVATVTVASSGFYDPRFGASVGTGTTQEIREFMMDVADGQVRELSLKAAEQVLQRDAELFKEFKKMSSHKQKDELYRYIRKYNERHEIYYLR